MYTPLSIKPAQHGKYCTFMGKLCIFVPVEDRPQNNDCYWFFKVALKSKLLFQVSKNIRLDMLEGSERHFGFCNLIFRLRCTLQNALVLVRVTTLIHIGTVLWSKIRYKMSIFQSFSKVQNIILDIKTRWIGGIWSVLEIF